MMRSKKRKKTITRKSRLAKYLLVTSKIFKILSETHETILLFLCYGVLKEVFLYTPVLFLLNKKLFTYLVPLYVSKSIFDFNLEQFYNNICISNF